MADIKNATIEFIGEIVTNDKGDDKVLMDLSTPNMPKTRFLIYKNKKPLFDILRKIKRGDYSVGDKVCVDYNEPTGNYYPTIWRITNHKKR